MGDEEMTKEMRKKYALVAELAGRLRRPAGGKDMSVSMM